MKKVTLLLATWVSLASAQGTRVEEPAIDAEPLRRYTVEIIIFAYTEDASVGSEIFVPDSPPPDETLLDGEDIPEFGDSIIDAGDTELAEKATPTWVAVPAAVEILDSGLASDEPYQLVLLQEDEMQLGDIIDRFELLDAYETLMHFGWTQPAFSEEETPPIDLQLLGQPPPGLAGTLTLYLSRFLHLVVDVALDAPTAFEAEVIDEDIVPSFGDDRPSYDDAYQEIVMPVRFRIQEDRILKNDELRYFDHPKFGVLAKVTRVEEPDDPLTAEEDATTDDLAVE